MILQPSPSTASFSVPSIDKFVKNNVYFWCLHSLMFYLLVNLFLASAPNTDVPRPTITSLLKYSMSTLLPFTFLLSYHCSACPFICSSWDTCFFWNYDHDFSPISVVTLSQSPFLPPSLSTNLQLIKFFWMNIIFFSSNLFFNVITF